MAGGSALHCWRHLGGGIPDEFCSVSVSQLARPNMRAYQEGRCRAGPKRHLGYDIRCQACEPAVHLPLGFRDSCRRSWSGRLKGKKRKKAGRRRRRLIAKYYSCRSTLFGPKYEFIWGCWRRPLKWWERTRALQALQKATICPASYFPQSTGLLVFLLIKRTCTVGGYCTTNLWWILRALPRDLV